MDGRSGEAKSRMSTRKMVVPLMKMWDLGGDALRKRKGRLRDQF